MSQPRHKFFVDENLIPSIVAPLTSTFRNQQFCSSSNLNLLELKDIPLFEELSLRDFEAIITADKRHMLNLDERAALQKAGLHWIRFEQTNDTGINVPARQVATITMGLPFVLSNWQSSPTAYLLSPLGTCVPEMVAI